MYPCMNCKFVGPQKIRLGSVLLKQYGDFAAKQTNTGIARSACEIACLQISTELGQGQFQLSHNFSYLSAIFVTTCAHSYKYIGLCSSKQIQQIHILLHCIVCKHEVTMMRMCKEVVIKIVVALKIVDGSQKKFTFVSV